MCGGGGGGAGLLAVLCVMFSCVFVTFPLWCPRSGVVLDCIDSFFTLVLVLC